MRASDHVISTLSFFLSHKTEIEVLWWHFIGCSDPGQVANAGRTETTFNVGGMVTYTCNPGFTGGGSRFCQSNGVWLPQAPTCTPTAPSGKVHFCRLKLEIIYVSAKRKTMYVRKIRYPTKMFIDLIPQWPLEVIPPVWYELTISFVPVRGRPK